MITLKRLLTPGTNRLAKNFICDPNNETLYPVGCPVTVAQDMITRVELTPVLAKVMFSLVGTGGPELRKHT